MILKKDEDCLEYSMTEKYFAFKEIKVEHVIPYSISFRHSHLITALKHKFFPSLQHPPHTLCLKQFLFFSINLLSNLYFCC